MKEADYFRLAFHDADYRREKILELRERKKFTLGLLIFGGLMLAVLTVTGGLSDGKWLMGFRSGFGAVIVMAMVYTNARTRLAALEAMDGKVAEPASKPVIPAIY